ncbi:hypothetical protein PNOK_0595600 [Pyrrhoderma noxium]|uniref:Uncharacterized protein n=1 Tax=Pyrrhoderma noxium TaxID=2282107 RepID=A0A286UHN2_9AGAM|nr:hypothetical protein PNOK_0595600 [Pyrrhoderma noxium]
MPHATHGVSEGQDDCFIIGSLSVNIKDSYYYEGSWEVGSGVQSFGVKIKSEYSPHFIPGGRLQNDNTIRKRNTFKRLLMALPLDLAAESLAATFGAMTRPLAPALVTAIAPISLPLSIMTDNATRKKEHV